LTDFLLFIAVYHQPLTKGLTKPFVGILTIFAKSSKNALSALSGFDSPWGHN
jgi:hypothetical protein